MLRRGRIAPTVLLAIVALSGCTAQPPAELSESPATIAPTTATASAYTCDDIATLDNVAAVFVTADGQAALPPGAPEGAVEGEHAMQISADTSSFCTVIFSLGQSAHQVESRTDAVAVAEAVIAQSS